MLDLFKTHQLKDWKNKMHLPQLRQLRVTVSIELSKKNLLMMNFPWLPPMQVVILLKKRPRVRKLSSVPNREETTMCSLIVRKIPIVKSVRRQKPHEPGVEENQRSAWMELHFLQNSEN